MGQERMKFLVYLLLAGGGLLVCDALWLRAKALVAQALLQRAWEETVRTGASVKAWPWADSWPVARLRVARLGIDAIVLEGDSGEVLAFGPGHVSDSAPPGGRGNCVLAGHRDTSFSFLRRLRPGDELSLEATNGRRTLFRVTGARVTDSRGLYLERPRTRWLTLITCYPFDAIRPGGPQRYVVFARVEGGGAAALTP